MKPSLSSIDIITVTLARYPKTTVDAATDRSPTGFSTLKEAFQWPDVFLKRLGKHYGSAWLCKRLRAWRWTFSTAFSGVGAPESVNNPVSNTFLVSLDSHHCLSPAPSVASLRLWQAWKRLQSITFNLWEPGYRPIAGFSMASHVRLTSAAEISCATRTTALAISQTSPLSMQQRKPSSVARTMACAKCGSTVVGIESRLKYVVYYFSSIIVN